MCLEAGAPFPRRIKVLQVLEAMGGGTTKLLYELITHLDPDEFQVSVALPPPAPYDPVRGSKSRQSDLWEARLHRWLI
jgi:hypothetical protein